MLQQFSSMLHAPLANVCRNKLAQSCSLSPVSMHTGQCLLSRTCGAYCCRPGPPVPRLLREGISESQAKQLVDSYVPMVNRALGECTLHVSGSALQLQLPAYLTVWLS